MLLLMKSHLMSMLHLMTMLLLLKVLTLMLMKRSESKYPIANFNCLIKKLKNLRVYTKH